MGILCFTVLLVALVGFQDSLQAFYWGREIVVPSVVALAPTHSEKMEQVILANVHPPGNTEFVRTIVESEQTYKALLHKGWLEQVNANQKRLTFHLVLWSITLGASSLAVGLLLRRRNGRS